MKIHHWTVTLCFIIISCVGKAQTTGQTVESLAPTPAVPITAPGAAVSQQTPPSNPSAAVSIESAAPANSQTAVVKSFATKSVANTTFDKAMYFDQIKNGVVMPPLQFEYDLSSNEGKELKIGPIVLSRKTLSFMLVPLIKGHPQMRSLVSPKEGGKLGLFVMSPPGFFQSGQLELISRSGETLWSHEFSERDYDDWSIQLENWKKSLLKRGAKENELNGVGIFNSQFGILDVLDKGASFEKLTEAFRICISKKEDKYSSRLCSSFYGMRKTSNGQYSMGRRRAAESAPRAIYNGSPDELKRVVELKDSMPISFYAELSTGESYEFFTPPPKPQIMDISDSVVDGFFEVTGAGPRAAGNAKILNPDDYGMITKLIGFESTIGDKRKFWTLQVPEGNPSIYLPGPGGGLFKQTFDLPELPVAQSRTYLHKLTPAGTYSDGIWLSGRKLPNSRVSSKEYAVKTSKKNSSAFEWNFRAKDRGKMNRAYLNVEYKGKSYKSYYEIYKGFPNELSFRLSGVATRELLLMGEFAYNHWFEDVFGWTNYYLSRQRWGASLKYFQSITQLTVDTAGAKAALNVLDVDLKYRSTPGLWERDETVGPILSYQDVTFGKVNAPMLGFGGFWARSMPRVFDDIFNYIPFFRYPKWVDMEFIYYMTAMDPNIKLSNSLALNFHGKVLWTQRIFGEAGFGVKRYGFSDSKTNTAAGLNTFYGTFGLGMNF